MLLQTQPNMKMAVGHTVEIMLRKAMAGFAKTGILNLWTDVWRKR